MIGISLPPSRSYQTFAGFLLQELGTTPTIGDRIDLRDGDSKLSTSTAGA
ncbi:transporter associated domain-containing protein [Bradyrhizobium sp. 170]|nr:transporter associated domain-containing protein [Bradyrhizobium sp. 170]